MIACGVLVVVFLFSIVSNGRGTGLRSTFEKISENPEYLGSVIDLELPAIETVDTLDNCGSQMSTYTRFFYFAEPIPEDGVGELQDYYYGDSKGRYSLECHIYKDYAEVVLTEWDDFTPVGLLGSLFSFLGFPILIIWGIVLGIIAIVRRGIS